MSNIENIENIGSNIGECGASQPPAYRSGGSNKQQITGNVWTASTRGDDALNTDSSAPPMYINPRQFSSEREERGFSYAYGGINGINAINSITPQPPGVLQVGAGTFSSNNSETWKDKVMLGKSFFKEISKNLNVIPERKGGKPISNVRKIYIKGAATDRPQHNICVYYSIYIYIIRHLNFTPKSARLLQPIYFKFDIQIRAVTIIQSGYRGFVYRKKYGSFRIIKIVINIYIYKYIYIYI